MRDINLISKQVVDASFYIHSKLGTGLMASVYETILAKGLKAVETLTRGHAKQLLTYLNLRALAPLREK